MNKLKFREELTLEADNNAANTGVYKEIELIKSKMKACVDCRNFTISLIEAHRTMAIGMGTSHSNVISLFVPKLTSPLHYRQLFIDELTKLGFTEECMELYIQETDLCDYYNIKLTW